MDGTEVVVKTGETKVEEVKTETIDYKSKYEALEKEHATLKSHHDDFKKHFHTKVEDTKKQETKIDLFEGI